MPDPILSPTGVTEFRLKAQDSAKEYDIQVRYFHLKAVIAIMIIGTACLLYLAPFFGYPGVVVPETLTLTLATILGSFFMTKGTSKEDSKKTDK